MAKSIQSLDNQLKPTPTQAECYRAAFNDVLATYSKGDQSYILANLSKDNHTINNFIKLVCQSGEFNYEKTLK